jgi:Putative peptidoglycan binding domain/Trypsin-like peptidase domain
MQHRAGTDSVGARGLVRAGLIVGALAATTAAGAAPAWQPASRQNIGTIARPIAVFGSDERMPVPAKYKDLQEKIGLLFNRSRPIVCTAFCVAKDVIATASHCLHGTGNERPARVADFWFARNFDAVRDYARVGGYANGGAAQHVMAGATSLSVRPPIDAGRDWALIRLARPACAKGVLPVRVLPIDEILSEANAQHVFQIAYHRDFTPWKPAYSRPCGVAKSFEAASWDQISHDFAEPQSLILHTCDTGGASSGSPILLETETGPEVIGINVGTYVQSKVLMQEGKVKQRLKADTVTNTGVASVAFAAKLEAFQQAVILSSAAEVRELQGLMKQRDLYSGPVDGIYSAVLKQAIEAYEKAEGLQVTGLATVALLQRLGGGVSATVPERVKPKTRRVKS